MTLQRKVTPYGEIKGEKLRMRFYFTDFFRWEKPLIEELKAEGYYVYSVRDTGGIHYQIEENVIVNNIGYCITDTALDLKKGYMTDEEFISLQGVDCSTLADEVRLVKEKISDKLNAAKAEYDSKEAEREKAFKEALKLQDNRLERERFYKLSRRSDNPVYLPDGNRLTFQTIYNNGDGTQKVMYFICNSNGKITVDSTTVDTKLNCRYKTMIKAVAKRHGLAV